MPKTPLSWNSCSASGRFNRAEDSPFFWMKLPQSWKPAEIWLRPMAFSGGSGSAEVNRAPARGWVIRWQQASQSLSGRGKFWHLDTTDVLMILSRWGGFWQQKCGHRKKKQSEMAGWGMTQQCGRWQHRSWPYFVPNSSHCWVSIGLLLSFLVGPEPERHLQPCNLRTQNPLLGCKVRLIQLRIHLRVPQLYAILAFRGFDLRSHY